MELWVLKCAKVLTCEGIVATSIYNVALHVQIGLLEVESIEYSCV